MDFNKHVSCFLRLLDKSDVAEFLRRDTCGALCDKYHIVIIFQYFMRAEFKEDDYTTRNFFLALALSHDLYDESNTLKDIILAYYLSGPGGSKDKRDNKIKFHWDKVLLLQRMHFKGYTERNICKQLCRLIQHKAFYKQRKELHTGIISCSVVCSKCQCPMNKLFAAKTPEEQIENDSETCSIESDEPEQKAKKLRMSSPESGSLFFQGNDAPNLSIKERAVGTVC